MRDPQQDPWGEFRSLEQRHKARDPEVMRDAFMLRAVLMARIEQQAGDVAQDAFLLVRLIKMIEVQHFGGQERDLMPDMRRVADRRWVRDCHAGDRNFIVSGLLINRFVDELFAHARARTEIFRELSPENRYKPDMTNELGWMDVREQIMQIMLHVAPVSNFKPNSLEELYIGEEAINNYHDDMAATLLDSVSEHHNYLLDEIARRWNASGDSHNLEYEACYFITAKATREHARAAMNALPKDIREMMGYK